MMNFYKTYNIHDYKRPKYTTKTIQSPTEINKEDFFYNGQAYIW